MRSYQTINMYYMVYKWRHGSLMVSVLSSGLSGRGLSPGRGHHIVLLGKTLYSHGASLHPGVHMGTANLMLEVTL